MRRMEHLSVIKFPIAAELEEFSCHFANTLKTENALLDSVLAHIMQKHGKMMRPILLLLTAKLFGRVDIVAYHAATSLELLHTASLVHDDVVDESTHRRGQLSVNAIFNNKVSVLSGDFLLATALKEVGLTRDFRIVDVVAELGQNLSDGELLQLANISSRELSEEAYFKVIRQKTAVLFAACTQTGALAAGASDEMVEKARRFGEYVGLCFQIKDDVFDYAADSREIGKPTGNDMKEGKLTLPALYALNTTDDPDARNIAMKVKDGDATSDEIDRLIDFSCRNGGIEYAFRRMDELKEQALALLAELPDSDIRKSLAAYVDYVVERRK